MHISVLNLLSHGMLQKQDPGPSGCRSLHVFKLFLRQYAYCQEHDRFEAVSALPAQLPALLCQSLDMLQAIKNGMHTGLFDSDISVCEQDAWTAAYLICSSHHSLR